MNIELSVLLIKNNSSPRVIIIYDVTRNELNITRHRFSL